MAHRDRVGGSSGRRKGAGDAVHRQNISTPSDGAHTRPERRLTKALPNGLGKGDVCTRCAAGGGRNTKER